MHRRPALPSSDSRFRATGKSASEARGMGMGGGGGLGGGKGSGKMVYVASSRRHRYYSARASTPISMRFASPGGAFAEMAMTLYNEMVSVCTNQPMSFGKYCDNILKQFPFIIQGLDSRDTAQRICLNIQFCSATSYAVGAAHNLEQMPASDM